MNRTIKFRAWIGDKMEYRVMAGYLGAFYGYIDANDTASAITTRYNESVPVMQYTGIKDKNGKEIYEGDIVRIDLVTQHGVLEMIGKMVFDEEKAQFGTEVVTELEMLPEHIVERKAPEIIGNIYENPELLK